MMPDNAAVRYVWGPLRSALGKFSERNILLVLSVVTGLLCGLAAVVLKLSIKYISHWLMSGLKAASLDWMYLVLPGVGMLLSLLIVKYIIKDNIGHGVTRVLVAVSKNESRIPRHNTWSSLVTSALTIGFGGSVGAEAPIVYTGAAIGSTLGRYTGLSYRNITVLLGCGAAGAVAGIFNAPLAGVLFTLEVLLFNISMSSILPLLLSTVSATIVSYVCLGRNTLFAFTVEPFSVCSLPLYLALGVVCGLFSVYFIRTTLKMEDILGKVGNPYVRWAACAVGLGILVFLFRPLFGEGYDSLGRLLSSPGDFTTWKMVGFFALVLLLKVFAMTLTNAGGGVGGTFGPTLVTGGLAGFVVGTALNLIHPSTVPVSGFVLVGMAGMMSGVMQAPMTAIFLIAEISGGYGLLVPLILTSAVAFGTTRLFEKYSIYTKRIANTGELLTHDSDQAVLTLLKTSELVETDFSPIRIDATLGELVDVVASSRRNIFPVVDGKGRFQGYVSLEDIRKDMFRREIYDKAHVFNYMRSAPAYISPDESMESVMIKFGKTGAWNLPVVSEGRIYVGFVSKSKIFNAYRDELKEVSTE